MTTMNLSERTKLLEFQQQLAEEDWHFELDTEGEELLNTIAGDLVSWRVRVIASVEPGDQSVRIISSYLITVPEARRHAVAELLARLNTDLAMGHFYMLFDTGGIGFDAMAYSVDQPTSRAMLLRTFYRSVSCMNDFSEAVLSTAFGDVSVKQAYDKAMQLEAEKSLQSAEAVTLQ
jgi:hypothetical protein